MFGYWLYSNVNYRLHARVRKYAMDENDWYHINYKHVKKTNFASFKNNIRYGSNVHHMSPPKSD